MTIPLEVTVAICTYRRYRGVARTLDSLLRQSLDHGGFRVLIIDNAPNKSASAATELGEFLRGPLDISIITEPAIGVSNARNRAMTECRTELLAYLDDDCEASPIWLMSLLDTFRESGSDVGAVGGKATASWEMEPPAWISRPMMSYLSVLDWGDERTEIHWPLYLVGGNILFSIEAMKRAGGFRTSLGRIGDVLLSGEEVDICNSLNKHGYRLIYEPNALVSHHVSSSRISQSWFRKRVFWQSISDALMMPSQEDDSLDREPLASVFREAVAGKLTLADLGVERDSPDQFRTQLILIYELARSLAFWGSTQA